MCCRFVFMAKVCKKCGKEKSQSEFKPYTHRHYRTGEIIHGFEGQCKECSRKYHLKYKHDRGTKPRIYRGVDIAADLLPCYSCKENKPKTDFRIRGDRKCKKDFYNPTCKACERKRQKEYYNTHKDNHEFKKKNIASTKAYAEKSFEQIRIRKDNPEYKKKKAAWELNRYYRNKDRISARLKIKRQTTAYKENRKRYIQENKEKIHQQEIITKRRYQRKNVDGLTDKYIIRNLVDSGIDKEIIIKAPELIEAKRFQLLIKRKIKTNGN